MVDYSNIPRDSRRVPLETRVQFKFDRFSGFLSEYSANISPGGLFLRTRAPLAQGTVLDFEFRLGDGFELIRGRGEVVWTRSEDEGTARPAGMGIRFLELAPGSKELIYRIVDQHILQGGTPFDVTQRPPDSTPASPSLPPPANPAPVLPPMAQAFAASLTPQAPASTVPAIPVMPPSPVSPVPPAAPAPPPAAAGTVFDLPPAVREPEPKLPDAMSWLPSPDDPGLDPLAPPPPPPSWTQEPRLPEPFPELLPSSLEREVGPGDLEVPSEYLGDEPAEPAAATPMFATTFGAASARPRRRILPLALLAAGLILAAAVFLLRDQVMEMVGLGGEDEPVVQPMPRRLPRRAAPAAMPPGEGTPQPADPALEGTPPATSDATPAPVEPEATPTPLPPPLPVAAAPKGGKAEPIPAVAEEPETGPALTRLDRITFEQTAGGTDILLWGDGAIRAESFTRSRIDGNPPRELIRLSGIRREFSPARVAVGTSEVLQVRVGYHPEAGRGELHVVLDLTRPNVVVTGVEPGEHRLRIRLQRK